MTITPTDPSHISAITWSTLHIEPGYRRPNPPEVLPPVPGPATPQAVAAETARILAGQMTAMPMLGIPVVSGSLAPAMSGMKVGGEKIAIIPPLGFNSWGF